VRHQLPRRQRPPLLSPRHHALALPPPPLVRTRHRRPPLSPSHRQKIPPPPTHRSLQSPHQSPTPHRRPLALSIRFRLQQARRNTPPPPNLLLGKTPQRLILPNSVLCASSVSL